MRQIEIDLDVFARIWAERMPNEINENEVLRRLLFLDKLKRPSASKDGEILPENNQLIAQNEVKTSNLSTNAQNAKTGIEMGKIRWVDDIFVVLKEMGGKLPLLTIYREVEKRRRQAGRSLPPTLEAIIRRTLEDHSSDSANFRGEDFFRLVGRGEWALR